MPTPSRDNAPTRAATEPFASQADRVACRKLIRTGSKSFHAASLLLPRPIRDPAYAIYAFCRLADDGVDLEADQNAALRRLEERLKGIYDGAPADVSADRALADVVREFGIPKELFDALLEGFAWDVEGREYETLDDLYGYAARVAGAVGAIMTLLMGRRSAGTLARACDLGVAMQLTNIARDVGEDARNGRIYLPLSWMRAAGIDPRDFLRDPVHSDALAGVIDRLLAAAEELYERSGAGVADLPFGCRPAINAARRLYAEIGSVVAGNNHDSISSRAVVSARRKLGLVVEAALEAPMLARGRPDPALEQTAFLVEAAVAARPSPRFPKTGGVVAALDRPVGRMLEILMEVDRREKLARAAQQAARTGGGD
jgi:phytoene synthase